MAVIPNDKAVSPAFWFLNVLKLQPDIGCFRVALDIHQICTKPVIRDPHIPGSERKILMSSRKAAIVVAQIGIKHVLQSDHFSVSK